MRRNRFRTIVEEQLSTYPGMELQDLYKLIYQGVMGSGHAISSEAAAERWLSSEMPSPGDLHGGERLFEEISPDGKVLRINLRPYAASGSGLEKLLAAFIRTGREYRGSHEEIVFWWGTLASFDTGFTREQLDLYIQARKSENFPAVHHSETYRRLYSPSYRVALRSICIEEGIIAP